MTGWCFHYHCTINNVHACALEICDPTHREDLLLVNAHKTAYRSPSAGHAPLFVIVGSPACGAVSAKTTTYNSFKEQKTDELLAVKQAEQAIPQGTEKGEELGRTYMGVVFVCNVELETMSRTMRLLALSLLALLQAELGTAQTPVPGEYPPIGIVATFRPVTATSVCGASGPEDYCSYTEDNEASLAPNCILATCDNTCPHSSTSPPPTLLATLGTFGPGVSTAEGRPGSSGTALSFNSSFVAVPAALVPPLGDSGFSFTAWIRQEEGNTG